jgi:hypothetical protein
MPIFGGGGGGGITKIAAARGAGTANGTDYTRTLTSYADVDNTNLKIVLAAATGDIIELTFTATVYNSIAGDGVFLQFLVAGTATASPTVQVADPTANTGVPASMTWQYAAQAGDISGGNITITIQVKVDAGTGHVLNDNGGLNRVPVITGKNLLH